MMNSIDIEQCAVTTIKQKFLVSTRISTFISDNDKEPSWDGHLYLYEGKKKRKADFIGRIPVQVKGTERKKFPGATSSYSMDVSDMRNYLSENGTILFVVFISPSKTGSLYPDTKIYTSNLTPNKLKDLLASCKDNQKKIAVPLTPLSDDIHKIENEYRNFYFNCQWQSGAGHQVIHDKEELLHDKMFDSIVFPYFGYDNDRPPEEVFIDYDIYPYARYKNGVHIPIEGVPGSKIVSKTISSAVTINGKCYFDTYQQCTTEKKSYIRIGEFMTITHDEPGPQEMLHFNPPSNLRKREKAYTFFADSLKAHGFDFNSMHHQYSDNICSKKNIADTEKDIDYFRQVIETFEKLGYKGDLNMEKLTDDDYRNIQHLIDGVLKQEDLASSDPSLPSARLVKVGDLTFILSLEPQIDRPQIYHLIDFFDTKQVYSIQDCQLNEMFDIPPCAILRKEEFLKVSNMRFNSLLPAYQKYKRNKALLNTANTTLLNLISAYDEATGPRKEEIYKTANDFADWLLSLDEWDKTLGTLNKLQIIKRKRKLNDTEKNLLYDIEESNSDPFLLVGVSLLLDDMPRAKRAFAKLTKENQEEFMKYPIYKFWNAQEE